MNAAPKVRTARRVVTLTLYYDDETDHIALNVDTPEPLDGIAKRRPVVALLRRALAQLEDRVAWDHVAEITQQPSH